MGADTVSLTIVLHGGPYDGEEIPLRLSEPPSVYARWSTTAPRTLAEYRRRGTTLDYDYQELD